MKVMESYVFFDKDVESIFREGQKDIREIVLKKSNEGSLLFSKEDAVEFAREFDLIVFEKNSAL